MNVSSGSEAVALATKWLGTPYQWGGGHGGPVPIGTPVDCSGLVNQVFGITGTTGTQIRMGTAIQSLTAADPGDLIFFGPLAPGEPYHVGIYSGFGMMIDAPHTGTTVRRDMVVNFGSIDGIRRLVPSGSSVGGGANVGIAAGNVQFTYAQLEGIWNQAGGNSQAAPIAAAIAMAESGGNSAAYDNDSNGSVDRGLWQINSVHGSQSTYDVMGNARAAVAISNNGTNWTPWVTYQTGAYRQYLQSGVTPDTNVPLNATQAAANLPGGQQAQTASFNIFGDLGQAAKCMNDPLECVGLPGESLSATAGKIVLSVIGMVLNPLIEITAGVLGMVGGGIIMFGGIYLIVRESPLGDSMQQGRSTALTAAGVLTGQPELIAAGSSGVRGYGRQRIQTIRGQQTAARQQATGERQVRVAQYRFAQAQGTQQAAAQRQAASLTAAQQRDASRLERERVRQQGMSDRELIRNEAYKNIGRAA